MNNSRTYQPTNARKKTNGPTKKVSQKKQS